MLLELTLVSWLTCVLLVLLTTRAWVFLALVALVEVIWVALAATFALDALLLNEFSWLFWGGVMFFFSAVELVMALVLFLALSQLGQAPLEA